MPKGTPLSLPHRHLVTVLLKTGHSIKEIQQELLSLDVKIAYSTITKIIRTRMNKQGPGHSKKFRGPRHPALRGDTQEGQRVQRHIIQMLKSGQHVTCAKHVCVAAGCPQEYSARHYRRWLKSLPGIHYGRPKKMPSITSAHKTSRVKEAKRLSTAIETGTLQLHEVLFGDEKKFSLDGPDGPQQVWFVEGYRPTVTSRIAGGGGCMVWVGLTEDTWLYHILQEKRKCQMLLWIVKNIRQC
jgi:transposase